MPCDNKRLSAYVESYDDVADDVKEFDELIKQCERTIVLAGRPVDEMDCLNGDVLRVHEGQQRKIVFLQGFC